MERLTKRIGGYTHGAEGRSEDNLTGAYCRGEFEAAACVEKLAEYEEIGTVEECREARERQIAKKYKKIHPCKSVTYYQCPCCNGLLHINENFCGGCGQAISWEGEDD